MFTRATVPYGLPHAPRMPVCSLHVALDFQLTEQKNQFHIPISTSTTQHLVDPQNVERVHPNTQMERILAARLRNILVGTDSGRLEGLTRELFVLIRDQVAAERELVHVSALAAQVENLDLNFTHYRTNTVDE